jgi:hypothetical protein
MGAREKGKLFFSDYIFFRCCGCAEEAAEEKEEGGRVYCTYVLTK